MNYLKGVVVLDSHTSSYLPRLGMVFVTLLFATSAIARTAPHQACGIEARNGYINTPQTFDVSRIASITVNNGPASAPACDGQSYIQHSNGDAGYFEWICQTHTLTSTRAFPGFPCPAVAGYRNQASNVIEFSTRPNGIGGTEFTASQNCVYHSQPLGHCPNGGEWDGVSAGLFRGERAARCVVGNFCADKTYQECPKTLVANPIDYRSGTKHEAMTDYSSGGEFPLIVSRSYSSAIFSVGGHWSFNFSGANNRSLHFPEAGSEEVVWVTSSDQTVLVFNSVNALDYTSDGDVVAQLDRLSNGWRLIDQHDRIEEFDNNGRITSVKNRNGRHHTYTYSDSSITVTDDVGRSITVTLDSLGNPLSIDLPGAVTLSYTYNANSLLSEVNYADGTTIQYHYEGTEARLLTGITDQRGVRYATFNYDSNNKAILSEHVGAVDSYSFLYDGLSSTVTNPLGKVTEHRFEEIQGGPKLKTSDRLDSPHCGASASAYAYDTNGFVSSTTDWEGNVTAFFKDSRGLSNTTTYAQGTPEEREVSTQWHSDYRIPEVVTEPGRETVYTFSPYDDPNYTARTVTDLVTGESRTWNYTYNELGQILSVDGPRGDATDTVTYSYYACSTGVECGQINTMTNGLGQTTTYNDYDVHGYPTRMTDANGVVTTMTYDLRQRLTSITTDGQATTIDYEPTGKVQRTTLPDGTFTEYVRDDANRLVAVFDGQGNRIDWTLDNAGNRLDEDIKDPNGTIRKSLHTDFDELSRMRQMIYAHGGTTQYEYDDNSNPITLTDADNRVSRSEYDALDRLIKEIDAIAGETLYTYDDRDNLESVTDPEGLTTTYTYNGFDEVVTEVSPDTGTTSYTYDSAGNMLTKTDARGVTATHSYDALNRVTGISYSDSSENIIYTYDQGQNAVGRLSGITDASGSTDYGYDARGNITSVTHTVNGEGYSQGYSYNGANRLIGMTYPSGREVSYGYDSSGRISQVNSLGEEGAETLADTITRLPFGPMESLTLGNGIDRQRSYDQDYRVTNLSDGSILVKGLGYSAVNNITAITDSVDSDLTQLFTYDDLDRLDFAVGNYGEDAYSYDGIGNRLSTSRDGQSESYSYGNSSHRLQSVAGQSYQYDAVGNTLDNGAISFAYNARNRLTAATVSGITTDYEHNALGQRVIKSSGSDETHYVYDLEGRLIAEAIGGSTTVEYAYLDGEPLVMWRDAPEEQPVELDTDADGTPDSVDLDDDNDGQTDADEATCGSDPLDSTSVSPDTDGDASLDCIDEDDDNDGVVDTTDAFPLDAAESGDADGDGIGDNADADDNNNGIDDAEEAIDTDGNGIPDITDTDDDNDGVEDTNDAFPLDGSQSTDGETTDTDGTGEPGNTGSGNSGAGNDINITEGSTNDFGSGFNVTFDYEVQAEDTQNGELHEWEIALGYTGGAQINNAWMSGYNGSVVTGDVNGDYVITNDGVGYTPTLSVGDTITFTVSGSGAGYNPEDFNIAFTSLDTPVTTATPGGGGDPVDTVVSGDATLANVNDWGSGFSATFECVLPGSGPINDYLIEFNYAGSATLTNSYMQGYGGGVTSGNIAPDGGYGIQPSGYVPPLNGGDTLSFVVQGSGSGFVEFDFGVECVVGGDE